MKITFNQSQWCDDDMVYRSSSQQQQQNTVTTLSFSGAAVELLDLTLQPTRRYVADDAARIYHNIIIGKQAY